MHFKAYRDIDAKFRIRKVVYEWWDGEELIYRGRMFQFGNLHKRLGRKKARSYEKACKLLYHWGK